MGTRFPLFSSVLKPKRVTEAIHQGASVRYMNGPPGTVNPLDSMATVTVLISWRDNCSAVGLPDSVDQLSVSLGAF